MEKKSFLTKLCGAEIQQKTITFILFLSHAQLTNVYDQRDLKKL